MGHLVESGGGTILGVASAGKSWNGSVVDWAVDDLVGRWDGIGENVRLTVTIDITAVVVGGSGGDGAALGCNC